MGKGLRAAHRIEAGWVQVNQGLGQFPGWSYGGHERSGSGREYALEGMLDSVTQCKSVTVNLERCWSRGSKVDEGLKCGRRA